jgi:hypothetical protein
VTSEKQPDKQTIRPKKKWLNRLAILFTSLFLALLLFHRPAITAVIRFAAVRIAASQHLRLQFDIEASSLTDLRFGNVRITPAGRTPVETISIQSLEVTLDPGGLFFHGPRNFLQTCRIKNANLIFKQLKDEQARHRGKPGYLGEDMHNWFFQPLHLIGHTKVENLSILARDSEGDFVLNDANVDLEREKPGWVRVAKMKIQRCRAWENIEGRATISNTDVILQDVRLSPDIMVQRIVSGPVAGTKDKCRVSLQAKAFGLGSLSIDYSDTKQASRYNGELRVSATKCGLDGLGQFFDWPVPLTGNFDKLDAGFSGDPGSPVSWRGTAMASVIAPAAIGALKLDHAVAKFVLDNGAFKLESSIFNGNTGKTTGEAHGDLPVNLEEFRDMPLDGRIQVSARDLSQSIPFLTHGSTIAEGHFTVRNREFRGELAASCKEINSEKFDASLIDLKMALTRKLSTGDQPRGPLEDLSGRITVQFQGARFDQYALDSGQVTLEAKQNWLHMDATNLKRETNSATVRASCHLPAELSDWAAANFDLACTISAPNVAAFNAEPNLTGLNGQFEAGINIARKSGSFDGKIDINGANLTLAEFNADKLNVGIGIEKNVARVASFQLTVDAKNQISGSGTITLRKPFDYAGNIHANLSDITVLKSVLADTLGIREHIAGAISADWSGSGQITEIHHSGQGALKITGGKYDIFQPITAEIEGKYSPESVEIPNIHVHVDKTDFTGGIALHDTELKIHDILLQQGATKLLQGEIMLPLDLRTPAKPDSLIPGNGRVFANLTSDEINLDSLLIQPKQTSPFKGFMKLSLNADGSLDDLIASILLRGRNLQVKEAPGVAPGNLELNCEFKENQLVLHGALQQPAMSPLQINGKMPFFLNQFLKDWKLNDQSPFEFSLKLEKSPATIIGQLDPDIRYIDGRIEIDAKAAGTIAMPVLSGAVSLDLSAIRLSDPDAPAVNGLNANLEFTGNQLTINRFSGGISGGSFNLTGRVLFQKLTDPLLDFRLTSQNALLLRNESLTVRADSDINIAGPFNAAHVSGDIGITKSQFFREIEILPIQLPGRPAPKLPMDRQNRFTLRPPLSNWTFDVAVKSKDPFLIHGNLTNGKANLNLKLVGTGVSPALEGIVRLDSFVASLPFSRLSIDYGFLYFSPENPFVPTLDIQGASSLRDYNIRVYISGTPSDPVSVFTSDPPLPQEQIVALLGTGATTDELTGRSEVLAGRAAVLLWQKISSKLFKRKQPQDTESLLTRFQLDPGVVNPRTGRQEVSARFKATDQFYLIGDIDEQGGIRGQVGYLLRFK